ncbi:MAG: hypothetical protein ACK4FS_03335 [Flavobacterium sp.]
MGRNYSAWPPKKGSVKTVWYLGRKSQNCFGFGICKHKKTTIKVGEFPPYSFGDLQSMKVIYSDVWVISKDELLIELDPLSKIYSDYYFNDSKIFLNEDFIIDTENIDLEITENFTIPAGEYSFKFNPNTNLFGITVVNSN